MANPINHTATFRRRRFSNWFHLGIAYGSILFSIATMGITVGGTKTTATGFCDGVQHLGSGLTGFIMGELLNKFGCGAWTYMIIPFSIIGGILMFRIWHETPLKAKSGKAGDMKFAAPLLEAEAD